MTHKTPNELVTAEEIRDMMKHHVEHEGKPFALYGEWLLDFPQKVVALVAERWASMRCQEDKEGEAATDRIQWRMSEHDRKVQEIVEAAEEAYLHLSFVDRRDAPYGKRLRAALDALKETPE